MFVEASTMRGKGELVLTGQLGDVMKESARAAWTYARSHAAGLHIQEEMFDRDVHIHVPGRRHPEGWSLAPASPWPRRWSRRCPGAKCATTSP